MRARHKHNGWKCSLYIVFMYLYIMYFWHPSKHKTITYHLYNVGLASWILVQHCISVIQMFCVYSTSAIKLSAVWPDLARYVYYRDRSKNEMYQDSKFEPWRSESEHATSRSRRLPTILSFTRGWGRNIFVSFKPPRPGAEPRTLAWKAAVLTTTSGPPPRDRSTLVITSFIEY